MDQGALGLAILGECCDDYEQLPDIAGAVAAWAEEAVTASEFHEAVGLLVKAGNLGVFHYDGSRFVPIEPERFAAMPWADWLNVFHYATRKGQAVDGSQAWPFD